MKNKIIQINQNNQSDRRSFVKKGLVLTLSGVTGISLLNSCKENEEGEGQEVSPPEDLMQEHGVLKRVLLIYDACRIHLMNKEPFPIEAIKNSANIIRTFVEDYHEKQE